MGTGAGQGQVPWVPGEPASQNPEEGCAGSVSRELRGGPRPRTLPAGPVSLEQAVLDVVVLSRSSGALIQGSGCSVFSSLLVTLFASSAETSSLLSKGGFCFSLRAGCVCTWSGSLGLCSVALVWIHASVASSASPSCYDRGPLARWQLACRFCLSLNFFLVPISLLGHPTPSCWHILILTCLLRLPLGICCGAVVHSRFFFWSPAVRVTINSFWSSGYWPFSFLKFWVLAFQLSHCSSPYHAWPRAKTCNCVPGAQWCHRTVGSSVLWALS